MIYSSSLTMVTYIETVNAESKRFAPSESKLFVII